MIVPEGSLFEQLSQPPSATTPIAVSAASRIRAGLRDDGGRNVTLGEAVDHLEGELEALERRHDVRAGDAMAYGAQHLSRDGDALLARLRAGSGEAHALAHALGHLHAGHLVVEELGVAIARERQEPHQHGQAERLDVVQELLEHGGIVDGLGHHDLGAGLLLLTEARDLALVVQRGGLCARREDEARARAERLAAGIDAVIEARRELEDADRVEIVDRRCVGKVAHLRRVAGDDDQVLHAELVRREEMRERREQVPIAPADVEDRLDPLLLHAHRHREIAHARLGARAVGDVDDVDAAGFEHLGGGERLREVEADRRIDLHRHDELAARDLAREIAALRERRARGAAE